MCDRATHVAIGSPGEPLYVNDTTSAATVTPQRMAEITRQVLGRRLRWRDLTRK